MRSGLTLCTMIMLATTAAEAAGKRIPPGEFPERGPEWSDPAPQPVTRAEPGGYPVYAQIMGIEGSATVGFTIDGTGKIRLPVLLASAPQGVFDYACLTFVGSFVYAPQRRSDMGGVHDRRWSFTCRYKFGG